MPVNSIRPSVFRTSYRLFERDLHPELFTPAVVGHVSTKHYDVAIGICRGGHYLKFTSDGATMLEVTAPLSETLSVHGLQRSEVFGSDEEVKFESGDPFLYHFSGEVDAVNASVFTRMEMELEIDARSAFLSHRFRATNRMYPGPISLAKVEGNERSITVFAVHTFPDDMAILRTQSLFELPQW